MKRVYVGVLLAITMVAPLVYGQLKSATAEYSQQDWEKLDHKWMDSERLGDLAYCEKFFAPSYVLVFPNGQAFTKDQWLGILRGPDRPTILELNPTEIKAHVFGNVAIITDHTTIKGHDSKGVSMDGEYNVFRVVIKQKGSWRATGVVMNQVAAKK
jgi:ketosteroid isomerase-like protein